MGIDPPTINWGTPIAISERGQAYVTKAMELPKDGADRLAFFQDYLEDSDEMLARDAYDEFAKTPYAGVHGPEGPDEARQAGRLDQEPTDPGQPPPLVPDDARRVRHARRPADAGGDDPIEGSPDRRARSTPWWRPT